jgi:hypothetical protein
LNKPCTHLFRLKPCGVTVSDYSTVLALRVDGQLLLKWWQIDRAMIGSDLETCQKILTYCMSGDISKEAETKIMALKPDMLSKRMEVLRTMALAELRKEPPAHAPTPAELAAASDELDRYLRYIRLPDDASLSLTSPILDLEKGCQFARILGDAVVNLPEPHRTTFLRAIAMQAAQN